ncbi:unnamed protein product [Mucor hiemalis]
MKVVDCPVFAAGDSPANGELEPYACPLIYCGERPYGQGNLSFFMCEKRVIENDSKQTQYFDRHCEGAYELCETNCTYIKSNEVWAKFAAKDLTFDNATRYATIGCAEGDFSTGDYKSRTATSFVLKSIMRLSSLASPHYFTLYILFEKDPVRH